MASPTVIFLTTTGTNTWNVPVDFNPGNNSVVCIGGGGNGGSVSISDAGGGGGGAYSLKNNVNVTPGGTASYNVGAASGDTWFSSTGTVLAKGGAAGVSAAGGAGGAGGAAGSGVGDTKTSGGTGGTGNPGSACGGGGGGAGGPNGSGVNGTNGGASANQGGPGGAGDNGSGGAGGTIGIGAGNPGGNGTEFTSNPGGVSAGSGGGGGGAFNSTGGNAGNYGGGGGAGNPGGAGAQGIIIITYTPVIDQAPSFLGRVKRAPFLVTSALYFRKDPEPPYDYTNPSFIAKFKPTTLINRSALLYQKQDIEPPVRETNVHFIGRFAPTVPKLLLLLRQNPDTLQFSGPIALAQMAITKAGDTGLFAVRVGPPYNAPVSVELSVTDLGKPIGGIIGITNLTTSPP